MFWPFLIKFIKFPTWYTLIFPIWPFVVTNCEKYFLDLLAKGGYIFLYPGCQYIIGKQVSLRLIGDNLCNWPKRTDWGWNCHVLSNRVAIRVFLFGIRIVNKKRSKSYIWQIIQNLDKKNKQDFVWLIIIFIWVELDSASGIYAFLWKIYLRLDPTILKSLDFL